jgi:hypothetical protein
MSLRPLISILGALAASAGLGCLGTGTTAEPEDIFPLAIGNTWVYADTIRYSEDSVTFSTNEIKITGTRALIVDGNPMTVFLSNGRMQGGAPSAFSAYVANIGHSNFNFGGEQDTARFMDRVLHLEYPTRAGRRYPTRFYAFRSEDGRLIPVVDTIDIEVVDPHHACFVPAGRFTCVQYRGYRPDGALFATAYHAPGVGYLGYEIRRMETVGDSLREVRYTRRLASYTLH